MTFPLLRKCNSLTQKDYTIWSLDQKDSFDHSGDDVERYLKDVIIKAHDVTSQSFELEEKIIDWTTEYYLSSQRANLLRALNLDGIKTALEFGAGCGAITRYLGEMSISVDAVERNLERARITKIRCRDLENISVINANFNELKLPKRQYDAVLLIGVLEYAKKNVSSSLNDKQSVTSILSKAKSALKDGGVLLIAIENRMGLKYWMGASEDHYGKPYIGLYGYPQDQGIRTYDKREWEQILDMSNLRNCRFLYPFPDYKIASTILSDDFIKNNKYAYSLLYGMSSREYFSAWRPNSGEFLLWESIQKSGYLEHFANSFFIVVSDNKDRLDQLVSCDFVHFSGNSRKPKFRIMTIKPRDKDFIVKRRLMDTAVDENNGLVKQNQLRERSTYIKGQLLSSVWIHSLFDVNNPSNFEKLIKEYYVFLLDHFAKQGGSLELFDLIPSNIVVDSKGTYKTIDKEWVIKIKLSPEYELFRGLMWFCNRNGILINRLYESRKFLTIKEFVEYGFRLCSLELKEKCNQFIKLEERLQHEICFQKEPNSIERMLMEPIQYYEMVLQTNSFVARLYWIEDDGEFLEERSVTVSAHLGWGRQILIFRLPNSVNKVNSLRLNPSDHPGYFNLFKVRLIRYKQEENKKELLWQLHSSKDIELCSKMKGIHFCKTDTGDTFLSTCDDPQIVFDLPDSAYMKSKGESFQFEVEMDWPRSAECLIAEDAFGREIEERDHLIQKISANNDRFNNEVSSLRMQLEAAKLLHERLLNSKSWRLAAQLRVIIEYIRKFKLKLKMIRFAFNREYKLIEKSGLFDAVYYLGEYQDAIEAYENLLDNYIKVGAREGRDPHPLFDTSYYLDQNEDIAKAGINPLTHYIKRGFKEGRDPHPLFDTSYYFDQNEDIAKAGVNPLTHYIEKGFKEGRDPHPLFDTSYYLDQNEDIAEAGVNPLTHYIENGFKEGRDPHPLFSTSYYLDQNEDIAKAGVNPLTHYIEKGFKEGRDPHPLFDTSYYLDQNEDIAEAGVNPLTHYIENGFKEGRDPHPLFSTSYYLDQNEDIAKAGVNPLTHYIENGFKEGKDPHPLFNTVRYLCENPDVARSGMNPLIHYVKVIIKEKKNNNLLSNKSNCI